MSFCRERVIIFLIICVVIIAGLIPYIEASRSAGGNYEFGGFLLNPLDGNSYLAKMYQGWRGDLRFTLPYTAGSGNGVFLFLFYLFLGHISRISGIPLIVTFHGARVISALIMLICLYRFLVYNLPQGHVRLFAFLLAAIGSGLGWIALAFGRFTSDFWVAETYPFLSAFTNPHFPLGLAFVLVLLAFDGNGKTKVPNWFMALISLVLAIIMPFGVVLSIVILAVLSAWEVVLSYREWRSSAVVHRLIWTCLGGIPVLIYDLMVTYNDPLLSAWNRQNQTPSPPIWDLVVSLSPVIILAVFGVVSSYKSRERAGRLLIVWSVLGILLLYIPWGLQRRFMLGLYIPLSALSALGLSLLVRSRRSYALGATLVTIMVIPTNLVMVMASIQAIKTHDSRIYLTSGEVEAFDWIRSHVPIDAVLLAAPDSGLFIPAHTGRRVIYGHPYETVDALFQKERVTNFFIGNTEGVHDDLLKEVDYLYVGPREILLGNRFSMQGLVLEYTNPGVRIYKVSYR